MPRPITESEPLLVRAPNNPKTGWGKHGLRVTQELAKVGVPMRFDPAYGQERGAWADALPYQWELCLTHPADFKPHPTRPTILITTWESGRIYDEWVEELNKATCILVPCEWNLVCLDAGGVNVPMRVVRHGCDTCFRPGGKRGRGPFRFGFAGALASGGIRKNPALAIDCFLRAFPDDQDVRLAIKLTPACKLPGYEEDSRIEITRSFMNDEELTEWYRSLDVMLCTSHSEGFGLHYIEAMGCGVPLVGPRFSGMCEYLDESTGIPITYDLAPADKGDYAGIWCVPQAPSLITAMQTVRNDPALVARLGAAAAAKAEGMTWERTAWSVLRALRAIGAWEGGTCHATTTPMRRPAVVFVTCNGWDSTSAMLESIRAAGDPCDLICVDNGSVDGTPDRVASYGATVIRNESNEGFAKAVNKGILAAGDSDVIILNNDATVKRGWIGDLIAAIASVPGAGLAGCRISPHSGAVSHCGLEVSQRTLQGVNRGYQHDLGQYIATKKVRFVTFCCVYLPRSTITKVGLLDESYFAYFEDVDYCLRAEAAGLSVAYAGNVRITHRGNGCTVANRLPLHHMVLTSRRRFFSKWGNKLLAAPRVGWLVAASPSQASRLTWLLAAANEAGVTQTVSSLNAKNIFADPIISTLASWSCDNECAQVVYGDPIYFGLANGQYNVGMVPEGVTASARHLEGLDEVWAWRDEDLSEAREAGMRAVTLGPCVDEGVFHQACPGDRLSPRLSFLSVATGKWEEQSLAAAAKAFTESRVIGEYFCLAPEEVTVPPGVHRLLYSTPPWNMGTLYRSADFFVPLKSVFTAAEAASCGTHQMNSAAEPSAWVAAANGSAKPGYQPAKTWVEVANEVFRIGSLSLPQ